MSVEYVDPLGYDGPDQRDQTNGRLLNAAPTAGISDAPFQQALLRSAASPPPEVIFRKQRLR